MQVEAKFSGANAVVTVAGRLDMTSALDFEQQLLKMAETAAVFVLDFSGVEFISSAGLRALMSLYRAVIVKNGSVTVINTQETVKSIFVETEFDALFHVI